MATDIISDKELQAWENAQPAPVPQIIGYINVTDADGELIQRIPVERCAAEREKTGGVMNLTSLHHEVRDAVVDLHNIVEARTK